MTGYSKYEVLEAVVKSTRDKTVTIDEVEKELKKLKVNPDEEVTDGVRKAVVDHFKLEKSLAKSDRALISVLKKENERLKAENSKLVHLLEGKIETIGKMVQEMYNYEPDEEPSTNDYKAQQMDLTPESRSQQ